ncbi:MAG TPA: P1 family peptidase [Acidimicrobiales bacterium]|nr:P1 family peptidase [Acidimicrobiales bacterium]
MSGTVDLGVPGVAVGHWTDAEARTGCTVVLLPEGTVGSAEVRGGAPASRELDALAPGRLVTRLDAVLLTGGSAFGLGAADGVMAWCERAGRGFPTGAGPVPIVAGLAIFDLLVGDGSVRPGPAEGERACVAAGGGPTATGAVGAGTGATTSKWRGPEHRRPGGLGVASIADGELVVAALAVVNAFGDVVPSGGEPTIGSVPGPRGDSGGWAFQNTTVGVVVTNARLDKAGCHAVAQGGHDGMARAVHPPHTSADGDAVVAAATGEVEAGVDAVRALAVVAFAAAVRQAVL